MADLQVIFASNPTKSLDAKKNNGKVKRKEKSRMKKKNPSPAQLRARKKFAAMARKRARDARAAKRGKKKNPVKYVGQKGKRKVSTGSFSTKKEISQFQSRLKKLEGALDRGYLRKGSRKGRAVKRTIDAVKKRIKNNKTYRRAAVKKAAELRKRGYKVKKVYVAPKSMLKAQVKKLAKAAKRKGKNKKRSSKKRAAKRVYGKESIVAKRRKSKRKSKRKVAKRSRPRRKKVRGKRRVIYLAGKGKKGRKSVTVRVKNPTLAAQLQQWTGFDATELGSLALGGAIYGAVDGAAARYLPQVYSMTARIPVVGTTVVPALIGVAIKWAGKQSKVKALEMVGEGLVAAAVVGMGINASQYVPGLAQAGVSGVDFTPALGGYASSGADFGRDPGNPDFGGVDFTPAIPGARSQMMNGYPQYSGQPQLGMQAQLGRDPGNPDFGEIPQGLDGVGEIPAGLA